MSDIDVEEIIVWARESGEIALRMFRNVVGHRKADHSWVTEADVTIERTLVERIAERFPDHGIIGEEQTRRDLDHEFLWALDPIDGTGVFLSGLATWGISLGLLRGGQPYMGVLYFPLLDDCYWALPGGGAFLNGQPIRVAPPRDWESDDWLATPSNVHRRYTIDFLGKSRSIGATIGTFCYVARGSAIGGLLHRYAIWDVAAAGAVLQSAGGIALGLDGVTPLDMASMLDGRTLDTPMLLGSPEHVQALRSVVHLR